MKTLLCVCVRHKQNQVGLVLVMPMPMHPKRLVIFSFVRFGVSVIFRGHRKSPENAPKKGSKNGQKAPNLRAFDTFTKYRMYQTGQSLTDLNHDYCLH